MVYLSSHLVPDIFSSYIIVDITARKNGSTCLFSIVFEPLRYIKDVDLLGQCGFKVFKVFKNLSVKNLNLLICEGES